MSKKISAVEWLVQEANLLENNGWILPLVEQAKQMEKEQIIQARTTAPIIPTIDMIDYVKESEQYYEETFKSE
jgi:hypothetical protein